MVTTLPGPGQDDYRFILRPDRSLSWQGNLIFVGSVAAIAFTIGIGFAVIGLWLVLPFAGLEIGLLTIGLYLTVLRRHQVEIVSIRHDEVEISKGVERLGAQPRETTTFPRAWVRVAYRRAEHPWYPCRLVLGAHGREVEIGDFLHGSERRSCATALGNMLGWRDMKSMPGDDDCGHRWVDDNN